MKIYVQGGSCLKGEATVQGAKNSALPILAATLLIEGQSVIHNCPRLTDVDVSLKILTKLGCRCKREEDTVIVDASSVSCDKIPDTLMREMRSSVVFLGAILSRCKSATVSSPGGCELGPRPIDLHLKALSELGYTINENHGYITCLKEDKTCAAVINLPFASVGATENAILASCLLNGKTIIHGAAKEPEISDLADFLNSAGGKIYGAGSDTIEIYGVSKLYSTEHTVIPDRIVAATYLSAAAITGGEIVLKGVNPSHFNCVLNSFKETGCKIALSGSTLKLVAPKKLTRIPLTKTVVYPGFPTDAGPCLVAMLTLAKGTSVFVENIFENRFKYIDELKRLGANISIQNKVAIIEGVDSLSGAVVEATDLRGGAALVVAALAARGKTQIGAIHHIERGYEDISGVLSSLGAKIIKE